MTFDIFGSKRLQHDTLRNNDVVEIQLFNLLQSCQATSGCYLIDVYHQLCGDLF